MDTFFTNKGCVITGAASGIGLATARLLHRQGARLALWDVNGSALQAISQELGVTCAVVDITQAEPVERALAAAALQFGSLDNVIHCAGILRTGLFENVPIQAHRRIVEVNLIGTLVVAHAALTYLVQSRGSLVLMGSSSAFYGPPEFASYGATKAGVLSLAQALRIEVEGRGVHIGICNPLFVDSPMLDARNRKARFVQSQGVTHTPEQVAQALLRGITRREFLIWPSRQPQRIYWLSRYLSFAAHPLMRMNWK